MAENFPNQKKETDNQIQETERVSNKITSKRSTSRHFIIRMAKVKDRESILNKVREKTKG